MNVNDKTLAGFNIYRRYDPFEPEPPKKKFCRAAFDRLLRYDPFMSAGGSQGGGGGVSRKRQRSGSPLLTDPPRRSPRFKSPDKNNDVQVHESDPEDSPAENITGTDTPTVEKITGTVAGVKKNNNIGGTSSGKPLDENDLGYFFMSETTDEKYFAGQLVIHTTSLAKVTGPPGVAMIDYIPEFRRLVEKIVTDFIEENCEPHEHIQVAARCLHGEDGKGVSTEFFKVGLPEPASRIFGLIARSMVSGARWLLDHEIEISIKHVKNPPNLSIGAGGHTRNFTPTCLKETASRKRSMKPIVNPHDKMCVARAIVVTSAKKKVLKAKLEKQPVSLIAQLEKEFQQISRVGSAKQTQEAEILYRQIGHDPQKTCGFAEIRNIERLLNIYIKILAADQYNKVVYDGVQSNLRNEIPVNDETVFFISHHFDTSTKEFHADAITCRTGFFGNPYYCFVCNKAFRQLKRHRCRDSKDWCFSCFNRDCQLQDPNFPKQNCDICQIAFRSAECRETHAKEAACKEDYFCPKCKNVEKRKVIKTHRLVNGSPDRYETNFEIIKRHKCKNICKLCKENVDGVFHKCFIQPTEFNKTNEKLLFYDFETDQSSNTHEPILCHVIWFNPQSGEWLEKSFWVNDVDSEAPGQPRASVKNRVGKFLFSKQFEGYTMIAHNMKAFDGCFILQHMAENGIVPSPILSGLKIMALEVKPLKMRFIDSLNFLPMPLAAFGKAFGLQACGKGHFPHFFAKPQNYNFKGDLPPMDAYGYNTMREDVQESFIEWYNEVSSSEQPVKFDFEKDIQKYCRQDVHVLKEGCLAFKELLMELTDQKCDPFTYTTLASVASAVYKATYLKPKQIAAVPPNGYASIQNFSSVSLEWLEWTRLKSGTVKNIQHIGNLPVGEAKIGLYRTDGFDPSTNTIYEFYGCYFHGCPDCFPDRHALNKTVGQTFDALHEKTIDRLVALCIIPDLEFEWIWECKWNKQKNENPEIQAFVKENQESLKPMDPFHSFFGGRVEPLKLQVSDGRKMRYFDVTSLYPFINATKKYPVGHPEIILNDFGDLNTVFDRYFGFMKCTVLPPENLYIPVLPAKFGEDKKLLFALCRTCAEERTPEIKCQHAPDQRALTGTWFIDEVKKAVEMGYELQRVHGVYHFEETSTELFGDYIRLFYKLKLISSGIPTECKTDDDLAAYITQVKEKEGIDLKKEDFQVNPGMRQLSKLLINSLWGKFGLRRNLPSHKFCTSVDEISELLHDETSRVANIIPLHENMALVTSAKISEEYCEINNHANIYIASTTTAWARLELYSLLQKLGERAIYMDTDSVIFTADEINPENDLQTGAFLGELTNELKLPGDYITDFISGGPKNYGYRTAQGEECVKVKGFSLNYINKQAFTFDNMKNVIVNFLDMDPEAGEKQGSRITPFKQRGQKNASNRDAIMADFHSSNPDAASSIATNNAISVFNPNTIKRSKIWEILSKPEQKLYTVNYDKRIVMEDFNTYPFGFHFA